MCLFDLNSVNWQLESWRKDLWELSHIGVPNEDKEARDCILFGNLVFWFLKEVRFVVVLVLLRAKIKIRTLSLSV